MTVGQLLTLLLGGGFVATVTAAFNGIKSLREGSRTRERDTIADLIARRDESDDRAEKLQVAFDAATSQRDYWRNRAGQLEYLIRSQTNVEVPLAPPMPETPAVHPLPALPTPEVKP